MAFKMKNPGMGKLAKSAGSPAKFGIEHKGIDSAARGTKGIGPDGEPMKMKKDFIALINFLLRILILRT